MPKKPIIKYTNADFQSIKSALVEHAKRYYPDSYNDFNDSSFGSMFIDMASYVGDVLSFYIDYQVNESFLETAIEYNNIRKMAAQMGYTFYGKPAAFGSVDLYVLIPSLSGDLGPNTALIPVIKKGTILSTTAGASYSLTEDVDFNNPSADIVSSKFSDGGATTEYAIRATGQVKSGGGYLEQVSVGAREPYARIRIGPNGINEVISVFDSEGHEFFQVNHLSQEIVYVETTNPTAMQDGVRSILKPQVASRRFIVEQDETGTYLQFGAGAETEFDTYGLIDPSTVMLNMSAKNYITDDGFDPNKLTTTDKLGIVPENTTLFVSYNSNDTLDVNVGVGSLNSVDSVNIDFPNDPDKNFSANYPSVIASVESFNSEAIVYDASLPTIEEIKYRSYAVYSSQNRAVTKQDYEAYVYQMPPTFGQVKRVSVYNDPSGTNKRMVLYVTSQNNIGHLTNLAAVAKNNIKVWLNKNKMISDVIDIKDAKIINVGFDYKIVIDNRYQKNDVLGRVQEKLETMFSEKMYIGEPMYITEIYNAINKTTGVIDTVKVKAKVKTGAAYAPRLINIIDILSPDGSYLKTPKNCILEIKYPSRDIKGMVV
jgi:hypothetical protein